MNSSLTLAIAPDGALRLANDDSASEWAPTAAMDAGLRSEFARSSAAGLLFLASHDLGGGPPAPFVFWKGWAQRLFQDIRHLGEEEFDQWSVLAPPDEPELAKRIDSAPPMRGLEYLTPDVLRKLWTELRDLVAAQASTHDGGPAAYLRGIHPFWNLLGRVTFHLAENKRDADRPFAFLATFAHRLSDQGKIQHLPLAKALIAYAGAKDQAKLETLLEPVRRAADNSSLIRELIDTRALFAPQAWTIRQAHRFLKEAGTVEEAGVAVRLPDWWSVRKPPRPQAQVKIGEARRASQVGAESLLDFQIGLALDGETLTAEEAKRLLQGTDELMLLRGKWVEVDRDRLKQALDHWKKLQKLHPDGISFIEGMRLLAGAPIAEKSEPDEQVAAWSGVAPGNWLHQILERLRHPEQFDDQDKACRPGRDLQATLRPYQVDGVRWLWLLTELGLGACLADDMGLGKTIQVIDLLLQRKRARSRDDGPQRPSLLIAPASLMGNWKSEIARFAPSLRVFFAHRSETSAEELAKLAADPVQALSGFDLVATTYGMARRQDWLEKTPWSLIVLDEAQAIKNAGSTQTRAIKKLSASSRIALTGSPV